MKNNTGTIIGIIVLLLVIAGLAYAFSRPSEEEAATGDEDTTEDVSGGIEQFVDVRDQLPGDTIIFENVNLEENGFVVARESVDGEPGDIVGWTFVEAGEDISGEIELEAPAEEGNEYFIELYTDTDGNSEFDPETDEIVMTEGGNEIRVEIETTEDLPATKG